MRSNSKAGQRVAYIIIGLQRKVTHFQDKIFSQI